MILVLASVGAFFVRNAAVGGGSSSDSKKVNLQNSSLREFLQSARVGGGTFHGITLPAWTAMSDEKKEAALKKIYSFGADKGYAKVQLIDQDGNTVGIASAEKIEVIAP